MLFVYSILYIACVDPIVIYQKKPFSCLKKTFFYYTIKINLYAI